MIARVTVTRTARSVAPSTSLRDVAKVPITRRIGAVSVVGCASGKLLSGRRVDVLRHRQAKTMRRFFVPVLWIALIGSVSTPARAQQQPNPLVGERLARQWCSSCHLVTRDQNTPGPDAAPPFASIAARPQATAGALRVLIQMPYPRMPQIALSRDETEHIIAYILSLGRR